MAKSAEEIKKEMAANSAAWHTADAATKKKLEAANQELGKQIGGSYNSASGTWSDSSGNALYTTPSSYTTTSSGGSKSGNSQYTGSSTAIKTHDSTQQAIKDKMNANSIAWWSADEAGKAQLEAANKELAAILGGTVSYDSASGTWSGEAEGSPTFGYSASQPSYSGKYDAQMDALLKQILNRDDFSYDVANDPLYQQYANMYRREGDRAMKEAMAEAAAGAGGMNTYAITAAQQANSYYNSQLNDKIPELYQLAYDMYLADKESKVQDLGILQSMDANQYNRYRDTMADWKDDRNFAYDMYRDAVSDSQWQTSFDNNNYWANKEFDYNDMWKNKEWDANQAEIEYNKGIYDKETARNEVWKLIELGVSDIDPELIKRADMDETTVALAVAAVKAEQVKKGTSSSGSGIGGSGYTGNGYTGDGNDSGGNDMSDYTIKNTTDANASDWISISGLGRVTFTELEQMVNKGTVIEVVDDKNKTVYYKKATGVVHDEAYWTRRYEEYFEEGRKNSEILNPTSYALEMVEAEKKRMGQA